MQTNKHETKEWSMVLNHSFGDGNLNCSDVMWPGDTNEVRTWIDQLQKEWRDQLAPVTDIDLRSPERTKWPFQDRPFGDGMGWVNVELTKNAAEIGYVRFLYAVRSG